ncbi:Ldh family oxidoreductase [Candidatus Poribacteria bacterium]|nr:Ldh family oxidoreductase [Candidatus Poribacteria bacterium]
MPTISQQVLRKLTRQILERSGVKPDEAQIISDHLVESNLSGHDSHGVIRVPGYVQHAQKGMPSASEYEIVKETPTTAIIDAKRAIGIVPAKMAMEMAIQKAQACTFGAVGVHRAGHTGRLGAYPPLAAAQGLIGICLLNGGSRFTAPFGGTSRRLPPNPISAAVPRKGGELVVLDMTTSVVAGGKIDLKRVRGEPLPEGWMIDADAKPFTDASGFRHGMGAVLPLGGLQFGHKGFGLGFLVDCLAGGLTWAGCSQDKPTRGGNGFLAMAIKIEDFIPVAAFESEIEALVEWVKSSEKMPGVDEIYTPGEVEQRAWQQREQAGIPLDGETWDGLVEIAKGLGVSVPEVQA